MGFGDNLRSKSALAANRRDMDVGRLGLELVETVHNAETEIIVYLFVDADARLDERGRRRLIIAVRGTDSQQNLMSDVTCWSSSITLPHALRLSEHGLLELMVQSKVHTGFWAAYRSVREKLLAAVQRQSTIFGGKLHIYATGHSMGGAVAVLSLLESAIVLRKEQPGLTLYNFGAPLVGNLSFRNMYALPPH